MSRFPNAPGPAIAVAFIAWLSPAYAQRSVLEHFNPVSANESGVHLYGVSISAAYFPNGYGQGGFGTGPTPIGFGGIAAYTRTTMLQGSAVLGWSGSTERASSSITYSPSYVRAVNISNYRSLNHSLSAAADRTLGRKWKLAGSFNGLISDFSQLLFARSRYGNVVATPATFEELFSAIQTGRSTNLTLTEAVNTAAVINSPETAYVYGDRLLSVGASASVAYGYSTRASLSMSMELNRTQPFRHGSTGQDTLESIYAIPRTTSASANIIWSYSVTPRTTASVNVYSGRTVSGLQDAYNTQTSVSVGRTLSQHWFVSGSVGVGFITPVRSTFAPSQTAQQVYGAGVGYKVYAHTFVGSYSRTVSDIYGLGANATEGATGAWAWKRPGAGLSLSASAGYSRLISEAFPNSPSWVAQGGVGKSLGPHLGLSFGFSYTQYPQLLAAALSATGAPNVSRTGVVVTLSWSPSVRR